MSIELPEAKILAEQMNKELRGKRVKTYHLQDYERLQRIGFINKDIKTFDQLVNTEIESIISRGNAIRVKLRSGVNLILAPEYGGEILYHTSETAPEKFHLKIDFTDHTALTVRLTSMGGIYVLKDSDLIYSYIFKRDFNPQMLSPIDEEFSFERFTELLENNSRALKPILVGKDAVVVGLSNSAFQDILYRARLHPKRKGSELNSDERRALYDAIRQVLRERIRLNGKDQFLDLYGNQGRYTPAMGPNMKGRNCPSCGTPIEKLSVGGGNVFFCPKCQV
ncbi:MAG TPA: DNA-formamidopyrimidine glycosylase family protein [Candidatus Krumholzibacteriaceae bacterium]|nr:DNA-formamidopyrimidine glycosylase family protein [Candidatus Krumholzibacteriaceae bacterium]